MVYYTLCCGKLSWNLRGRKTDFSERGLGLIRYKSFLLKEIITILSVLNNWEDKAPSWYIISYPKYAYITAGPLVPHDSSCWNAKNRNKESKNYWIINLRTRLLYVSFPHGRTTLG